MENPLIWNLLCNILSHSFHLLFILQVNYSQCLGVIGYSIIPLVLTALALPLARYFPMLEFLIKVNVVKTLSHFTWHHFFSSVECSSADSQFFNRIHSEWQHMVVSVWPPFGADNEITRLFISWLKPMNPLLSMGGLVVKVCLSQPVGLLNCKTN